jgi:hypothetical protein
MELDTYICMILTNIVQSDETSKLTSFLFLEPQSPQSGGLCVLKRFASRLTHSQPDVRRESLSLFEALLHKLTGQNKENLIQSLDLIDWALKLLTFETVPRLILVEIKFIQACLWIDCKKMKEELTEENEFLSNPFELNLSILEYFFLRDGENIILSLRDKFSLNSDIFSAVSQFEQRYLSLDLHELQ